MSTPTTRNERLAEVLASIRASQKRMDKSREEVLRAAAELRRMAEMPRRRRY